MNGLLERTYLNNTVLDYLIALGFVLLGIIVLKAFSGLILKRVEKWAEKTTSTGSFLVNSIDRFVIPGLYVLTFYAGLQYLVLSERVTQILHVATTVVITFLVIRLFSSVIMVVLRSFLRRQEDGEERVKQLGGLMIIVNIIIWIVGLLFLFENMGFDVTAVVAGLGIGGIAVALAAQNILGDLFNYFVIFLDRPFEAGDFIIVDDKKGVVDFIGIKTTRLKSLSGEQLVFSNSDLTNSRIHNYKRMERRRILFNIGVVYQTTHEKLRKIPALIQSVVEEQEQVEFDRAHFSSYGDFSLNFEIVYFVLSSDFGVYMDVQQAINLRIFEEFKKMEVEFAYPTQTLYLEPQQKEGIRVKRKE
jgi:small-conductance mechanosensitive channel